MTHKEALMSGTDGAQPEQEQFSWAGDPSTQDYASTQPEQEQLMSDQINYGMSVTQGGKRIDPMSIYKEPEQKPVAEVDDWRDSIFTRYVEYLPSGTRLYTTPLEPKPMTDEKIEKMCPKFEDPMSREVWIIGFKAAHGIKG